MRRTFIPGEVRGGDVGKGKVEDEEGAMEK